MSKKTKRKNIQRANRRGARKNSSKSLRIAAAADNWNPRDGKDRPTPERRRKGVFRLREGDEAGVSVAVDESGGHPVGALVAAGLLTARQGEAANIFEDVARGVMGSPSDRSCIDFEPIGHNGDDDGNVEAQYRWNSLRRMLSPPQRHECEAVCWAHGRPRNLDRLRRGLDATADWAGLDR